MKSGLLAYNQRIAISRGGFPLPGSPFLCGVFTKDGSQTEDKTTDPGLQEIPKQYISFQCITLQLQCGDLVTLPDGTSARLLNVRSYRRSLQCDIQRILTDTNAGIWLQQQFTQNVINLGSTVTLGDGVTTSLAIYTVNPDEFQKLVVTDGQFPGRSQLVAYFAFPGTVYGQINSGDTLTFKGIRYTVKAPMWPNWTSDVCTKIGIVGVVGG